MVKCPECQTLIELLQYELREDQKEEFRDLWKQLEGAQDLLTALVNDNCKYENIKEHMRLRLKILLGMIGE